MTLQSEDIGKLVAGKSVVWNKAGKWLGVFCGPSETEGYDVAVSAIEDPLQDDYPASAFTLIGTLTEDGWIEGEWAENPVGDMLIDTRHDSGDINLDGDMTGEDWVDEAWAGTSIFGPEYGGGRIIAFRPAHSEAQPESDGGGEAAEIVRRWANWIIDESSDMESDDHDAGKRKVRAERDLILAALASKGA